MRMHPPTVSIELMVCVELAVLRWRLFSRAALTNGARRLRQPRAPTVIEVLTDSVSCLAICVGSASSTANCHRSSSSFLRTHPLADTHLLAGYTCDRRI